MSALDLSLDQGMWYGHIPVAFRRAAWQTLQALKTFSINITICILLKQQIDTVHKHLMQKSKFNKLLFWRLLKIGATLGRLKNKHYFGG